MKHVRMMVAALAAGSAATVMAGLYGDTPDALHAWAVHDMNRPVPKKITAEPGQPPSDAIVLFDGTSLDNWESTKGEPTKWRLVDGALESVKGAGYIRTKQSFGDCQLHIEWKTPEGVPARVTDQNRSNSGVFFMGRYEVQVFDSWQKQSEYPGMECGGIYQRWDQGRTPPGFEGHSPRINASRAPGQWQSFEVVFRAPRFDARGKKVENARFVEVRVNGVVVQNNVEVTGPTRASMWEDEKPLGPIMLQGDHGPITYRNVWVLPIGK